MAVSIVAAVVAAGLSAYGAAQQKKAAQRSKRTSANASQMSGAGGGQTPTSPTANRFADGGDAGSLPSLPGTPLGEGGQAGRLQDVMKLGDKKATEPQQGLSLGIKSLGDEAPKIPDAQGFDVQNAPNPPAIRTGEDLTVPKATQQPSTTDQVNQYAQIAQSLYGAYEASKANRPQPGPLPQLGPMNLTPTAYRYGR